MASRTTLFKLMLYIIPKVRHELEFLPTTSGLVHRCSTYWAFQVLVLLSYLHCYNFHPASVPCWSFRLLHQNTDRKGNLGLKVTIMVESHNDVLSKSSFDYMKFIFSIPSDFQWLVLYYGVRNGGEEEWNFVFKQYLREKVPSLRITLLVSLCATKEPKLIERWINITSFEFP